MREMDFWIYSQDHMPAHKMCSGTPSAHLRNFSSSWSRLLMTGGVRWMGSLRALGAVPKED